MISIMSNNNDNASSHSRDVSETGGVNVSQDLQELISKNSELGSRLLSLLLVSSGNGKEIIDAINNGDLSKIQSLNIGFNLNSYDSSSQEEPSTLRALTQIAESNSHNKIITDSENLGENELAQLSKRKRNTEASARFRVRKKQREQEKLSKLSELNIKVNDLYRKIDILLEENRHWKIKLEELNERKSRELLENIKKRNATSP